jgi:hypothetical protein
MRAKRCGIGRSLSIDLRGIDELGSGGDSPPPIGDVSVDLIPAVGFCALDSVARDHTGDEGSVRSCCGTVDRHPGSRRTTEIRIFDIDSSVEDADSDSCAGESRCQPRPEIETLHGIDMDLVPHMLEVETT